MVGSADKVICIEIKILKSMPPVRRIEKIGCTEGRLGAMHSKIKMVLLSLFVLYRLKRKDVSCTAVGGFHNDFWSRVAVGPIF